MAALLSRAASKPLQLLWLIPQSGIPGKHLVRHVRVASLRGHKSPAESPHSCRPAALRIQSLVSCSHTACTSARSTSSSHCGPAKDGSVSDLSPGPSSDRKVMGEKLILKLSTHCSPASFFTPSLLIGRVNVVLASSSPQGQRMFAKTPSSGKKRKVPMAQDRAKLKEPTLPREYSFEAKKVLLVKAMSCTSILQGAVVFGFMPAFWVNLLSLDPVMRGLFLGSLGVTAISFMILTYYAQRRYVATVSTSAATNQDILITTPYYLGSSKFTVKPTDIKLSSLGLRDLLGRSQSEDQAQIASDIPMEDRRIFTIEVRGFKLLVDTEHLKRADRKLLQQVLRVYEEPKTRGGG